MIPSARILFASCLSVACLSFGLSTAGCGSSASASTATSTASTSIYPAVYQAATWGGTATVTYPASCTLDIRTTGVPAYHNAFYLAPTSTQYPTTVAYTPVSNTAMSVTPYMPGAITSYGVSINMCPSNSATATSTNMGVIGYMLNGEALYNPYEGGPGATPAMSDNVSYTFTSGGTTYTAWFIDQCNSHPTPLTGGYTWHYHGVPSCLTATVDAASGPSHQIGIALDGFPIYGGRDINGNAVAVSSLDSCNGITSATPEFPSGAYHYVLPLNTTGKNSSINCYTGTVVSSVLAAATRLECRMPPGTPHRTPNAAKPQHMGL